MENRDYLSMCPANERWRYDVTSSLIGWAHTQKDQAAAYAKLESSQLEKTMNEAFVTPT